MLYRVSALLCYTVENYSETEELGRTFGHSLRLPFKIYSMLWYHFYG